MVTDRDQGTISRTKIGVPGVQQRSGMPSLVIGVRAQETRTEGVVEARRVVCVLVRSRERVFLLQLDSTSEGRRGETGFRFARLFAARQVQCNKSTVKPRT